MAQTLEQRVKLGLARHQFSLDDYRDHPVDCHLHCSFCGDALLIDYFQFGVSEMNRQITAFAARHGKCRPGRRGND